MALKLPAFIESSLREMFILSFIPSFHFIHSVAHSIRYVLQKGAGCNVTAILRLAVHCSEATEKRSRRNHSASATVSKWTDHLLSLYTDARKR